MRKLLPWFFCSAILIVHAIHAWGFIQERTPMPSGVPIHWNLAAVQPNISGGEVVYIINKRGSDDVPFASVTTAVDNAFATWRLANGSVMDFVRNMDSSTATEGTLPNRADRTNVVFWDEDPRNVSGLPSLTQSVTIRDVLVATGEIQDADIVFNASQFRWAVKSDDDFTSLTGPSDIQEALTKTVGYLIGLNNVPTQPSVLHEYDYPGNIGKRALTTDELAAALDLYPPGPNPPVTSISGQVTRSGSPVFGAYVVAFQNGQPVVGAISDTGGNYSIRRVPTGNPTYTVRVLTAKPPFGSFFFSTIDNNFRSSVYLNSAIDPPVGTQVTVTPDADTPGINFGVSAANTADSWEPDNDTTTANPIGLDVRQVHHTYPAGDLDFVKFSPIVGHVYLIETGNLGSGAADSDTVITLTGEAGCPCTSDDRNPKQDSRTSRLAFVATTVSDHFVQIAQLLPSAAGSGTACDILVTDLGATPLPAPTASGVTPSQGSQGGGYQVTVTGSNFFPGAAVTFGATPGTEVDVVSSTKLFVTVPAAAMPGAVNVTVTNLGGSTSSPLVGGFTYLGDVTVAFTDVTLSALGVFPGESRAVAWVDYDLDGDLDLYFTSGPISGSLVANALYRNNGNGTFSNVTSASGINVTGAQNFVSATWGDFDNDGCPDVYLVNLIVAAERFLLRNKCDGTFQDVTAAAGVAGRSNGRSRDAAWADFNNDGFLDLFVAYDDLAGPNQLFRNNGNATFTDVAATAGVNNTGSGVNANWGDFDNDGWVDLFLVRSGVQSDILYKNNGNGGFTDVTAGMGIVDTAQGTDAVSGDLNTDGFLDLYVVGATGINHLFQNNGGSSFIDVSTPPTLENAGNSSGAAQGAAVADFDNDGDLDLVVVQSLLTGGTQEDLLFQNNGGSPPTFTAFTFGDSFNAYAACFGDYSGDGAPDLFMGNVGAGSDFLWLNGANRNDWLLVRLVGTTSNRMGVGACVSVTADLDGDIGTAPVTQVRQVLAGSKGQNPVEAMFGLGRTGVERKKVDNLTVVWPRSGMTQSFTDLATDQVITVFEGPASVLVTRVSPASGTTAGGDTVVVSGDNFDTDAVVTFDSLSAPKVSQSGRRSITVTTPAHGAGLANVTVTNPSRAVGDPLRQGTLVKGFLYFSGDPLNSLVVFDEVNTTVMWGSVPGAVAYDVISGTLASVQQVGSEISLGSVLCLENDSTDTTTAPNHRDATVPALGTKGFFYLLRVVGGTYGTSSSGLPRVPSSGDCP